MLFGKNKKNDKIKDKAEESEQEIIEKAKKEWERRYDGYCAKDVISKTEYLNAHAYRAVKEWQYKEYKEHDYYGWLEKKVIDAFRYAKPDENGGFCAERPELFDEIEIRKQQLKETEKLETYYRQAGKPRELKMIRKEYYLKDIRGDYNLYDIELLEAMKNSECEAWENKYTPKYLYSMAIIYLVLKARGIEPSPEAEEQLKYEILEKDVLRVFKYLVKEPITKFQKMSMDNYKAFIFPRIADLYMTKAYKVDNDEELHYTGKRADYHILTQKDGCVDRVVAYGIKSAWSYFINENLRELLFVSDNPRILLDYFKEDLEKMGVKLVQNRYHVFVETTSHKIIHRDNVLKDEDWKNYVYQPHKPYYLGGERSAMKNVPPLMFEALINRVVRIKEALQDMEKRFSPKELDRNADYLHLSWEYQATKLQVHLLDIRRATCMKQYNELPQEQKEKWENRIVKNFWSEQLGKYAAMWLNSDLELANEYIEKKPVENTHICYTGGWQRSDKAYKIKVEIAEEMKAINTKLNAIGECSPLYTEDFLFGCQDELDEKYEARHDFKDITMEGEEVTETRISLLRPPVIDYNAGNNEEMRLYRKSLSLKNNIYKRGIIRFDEEFIGIPSLDRNVELEDQMIQKSVIEKQRRTSIKDKVDTLLKSGVTKEEITAIMEEFEEKA